MPQEPILEPVVEEPIHIVPATTPPEPAAYTAAYQPTQVVPAVAYQPVPPAGVPVDRGPAFVDGRPAWPYFIALLALLLGGLIGFIIGNNRDDQATSLSSSTQPLDSTVGSTPTVENLQNQVDLLTAAQTKAAEDLTALQTTLTQTQAERDALAAQVGSAGGATTGLQADLDASKAEVTKLQADLKTVTGQLDTTNATLAQTQASLKTVQGQLDAANATLAALHPTPVPNYVNGPISKARSDAQTNGWTVIEQPANNPSANIGTVVEQTPAPNTTMVKGSVLYLKVT